MNGNIPIVVDPLNIIWNLTLAIRQLIVKQSFRSLIIIFNKLLIILVYFVYPKFYLIRFVEKNLNEGECKMNVDKFTFAFSLKTDFDSK